MTPNFGLNMISYDINVHVATQCMYMCIKCVLLSHGHLFLKYTMQIYIASSPGHSQFFNRVRYGQGYMNSFMIELTKIL